MEVARTLGWSVRAQDEMARLELHVNCGAARAVDLCARIRACGAFLTRGLACARDGVAHWDLPTRNALLFAALMKGDLNGAMPQRPFL